ncbi:hypothetical protein KSP35_19120 [Aquihabitans sp. G128]|uniref:hypothetical protein n=1 Tax=Aquihabitans sp. G128 TaxID=2849779 RepID=UPI001C24BAAA|nr:hypothetical protein [Aquihabitans sp. G128]QXC60416.1 hypothetical protein KSP35_19120 [Aquihabitans sp. G128]
MAQLDPKRIQAMVEEAIDEGATSVEEIHQAVAAAPLEALKGIDALAGPAETAQDLAGRSIGAIYDTIRTVNEQVGIFAERLLGQAEERAGD